MLNIILKNLCICQPNRHVKGGCMLRRHAIVTRVHMRFPARVLCVRALVSPRVYSCALYPCMPTCVWQSESVCSAFAASSDGSRPGLKHYNSRPTWKPSQIQVKEAKKKWEKAEGLRESQPETTARTVLHAGPLQDGLTDQPGFQSQDIAMTSEHA